MDALVSTDWLAAELAAPDLVVLDASWYMPGNARNARTLYAAAHLPGARFFDIDQIADQHTQLPHMVPAAGEFEQRIGELGVSNASRVVCYDQQGIFSAPRAWWMLRLFGHEQVAVLDGGLPKWRAEGRALQQGAPPAHEPARFRSALRAGLLRGLGDVRENLRTRRELLLDARSADRFHARVPEPRAGLRGGHVPGARSLPGGSLPHLSRSLRLQQVPPGVGQIADVGAGTRGGHREHDRAERAEVVDTERGLRVIHHCPRGHRILGGVDHGAVQPLDQVLGDAGEPGQR